SEPGIRTAHEVNSRHNQTTLGGASLRRLQGCGSFGPERLWGNSKRKEKEVGSRSLISSRPRCGRVRDDNAGAKAKSEEGKQRLPAVKASATKAKKQAGGAPFEARHSRSTRSQFSPQPNNAGWRVLAVLARARVFLGFRPARLWGNPKGEGKEVGSRSPPSARGMPTAGRPHAVRNTGGFEADS